MRNYPSAIWFLAFQRGTRRCHSPDFERWILCLYTNDQFNYCKKWMFTYLMRTKHFTRRREGLTIYPRAIEALPFEWVLVDVCQLQSSAISSRWFGFYVESVSRVRKRRREIVEQIRVSSTDERFVTSSCRYDTHLAWGWKSTAQSQITPLRWRGVQCKFHANYASLWTRWRCPEKIKRREMMRTCRQSVRRASISDS